jgi:biotin carboxylase
MGKAILMIFGAGINQLELIREAKKLNITTVVLDPSGKSPGKDIADYFYQVAGSDYESTKKIALKHNVDGIVTGQMEKPLYIMARLAKELNLDFHSPEVLERSLDKWLMKQAFLINNIPCAKGEIFKDPADISEKNMSKFNYPLIIKPKDAHSSRGVFKVDCFDEIMEKIDESLSFSVSKEIIIEEFLEGREYSVESVTFQGVTKIVQYTEKFITPYPNTVELGHLQPAALTDIEREEILKLISNTISTMGLNNTAAHLEIMLTKDGPKIIEIGPRLGGDFIASYLTNTSTGISMDKAAVQIALGNAPDIKQTISQFAYIKYIQLPFGKKIRKILDITDIVNNENVVFVHIFVSKGDMILPINQSSERPACVLVKGNCRKEVIERAEHFEKEIKSRFIYFET